MGPTRGEGKRTGDALGRPSSVGMQKRKKMHTINIAKHMATSLLLLSQTHACVAYICTHIYM